jgi:hypothetical protein
MDSGAFDLGIPCAALCACGVDSERRAFIGRDTRPAKGSRTPGPSTEDLPFQRERRNSFCECHTNRSVETFRHLRVLIAHSVVFQRLGFSHSRHISEWDCKFVESEDRATRDYS